MSIRHGLTGIAVLAFGVMTPVAAQVKSVPLSSIENTIEEASAAKPADADTRSEVEKRIVLNNSVAAKLAAEDAARKAALADYEAVLAAHQAEVERAKAAQQAYAVKRAAYEQRQAEIEAWKKGK